MPATTPASGKDKPDKSDGNRYVKCDLSDAAKADLKRWREEDASVEALMKWVADKVTDGHTLGLKGQENGYMATLTGQREQTGHRGMCLIARGSTSESALYALQYKDAVVLRGKWEAVDRASEFDL
jgi:hypothetical protein